MGDWVGAALDLVSLALPGIPALGTVKRAVQSGDDAVEAGTKIYRVWGQSDAGDGVLTGSDPWGRSWTDVDPRSVDDYRDVAGLPDANGGRFVTEAILGNNAGVRRVDADPLDGNAGGLPEIRFPEGADVEKMVDVLRVSGVNPEY